METQYCMQRDTTEHYSLKNTPLPMHGPLFLVAWSILGCLVCENRFFIWRLLSKRDGKLSNHPFSDRPFISCHCSDRISYLSGLLCVHRASCQREREWGEGESDSERGECVCVRVFVFVMTCLSAFCWMYSGENRYLIHCRFCRFPSFYHRYTSTMRDGI